MINVISLTKNIDTVPVPVFILVMHANGELNKIILVLHISKRRNADNAKKPIHLQQKRLRGTYCQTFDSHGRN